MNKLIRTYTNLPKEMYAMCFAKLVNSFGDFVVPFLALYLTQKIGMSAAASGIVVTLASIIGIPASLIGGQVADKLGRKKVYIYAQSISALALIPCAATQNEVICVTSLLISTFFNGFIRPAFSSIVTDILPANQRQAGFSLQYLSINVGVSIGPIVAGFLFNNLLPMLFIGDALTSFIAVFSVWKYIKETNPSHKHIKQHENHAEKAEKGNVFEMLYKRPHLCLFFLINVAYSFIYSQHRFALPITLNSVFSHNGAKMFGYVMSVNALTVLALTVFIGALTKKNHPLSNLVFAGISYAIGFGMLGYINHFSLFIVSTVIWTTGEILSTISSGVYVANNSPINYRARLNAISSIGWGAGAAISTSFSGIYIHNHGYKSIWTLTIFIALISALLMFGLKVFSKRIEKRGK
ncbi:MDR family MFS transporter [Clostridium oryzae]|uniref:Multidrug resistance protein MdtH n=1 Tax=Clostridium oryzae TaxID=1450648 RepID=A0A1V4ILH5_9CLOT|nr:MFS transporter [Clostridium oryzae]OPJ60753.1 multidrug resistance protein MdtH [Clostridium oryzae]